MFFSGCKRELTLADSRSPLPPRRQIQNTPWVSVSSVQAAPIISEIRDRRGCLSTTTTGRLLSSLLYSSIKNDRIQDGHSFQNKFKIQRPRYQDTTGRFQYGVFGNSNFRGHRSNHPCTQQFEFCTAAVLVCCSIRHSVPCTPDLAMKRSRSGLRHAGGKALAGVIVCSTGVTSALKVCVGVLLTRFQGRQVLRQGVCFAWGGLRRACLMRCPSVVSSYIYSVALSLAVVPASARAGCCGCIGSKCFLKCNSCNSSRGLET